MSDPTEAPPDPESEAGSQEHLTPPAEFDVIEKVIRAARLEHSESTTEVWPNGAATVWMCHRNGARLFWGFYREQGRRVQQEKVYATLIKDDERMDVVLQEGQWYLQTSDPENDGVPVLAPQKIADDVARALLQSMTRSIAGQLSA